MTSKASNYSDLLQELRRETERKLQPAVPVPSNDYPACSHCGSQFCAGC